MLRDAARSPRLCYTVLRYFNVAGADPKGPHRPVDAGRHAADQGGRRDGARQAALHAGFRRLITRRPMAPASATTSMSATLWRRIAWRLSAARRRRQPRRQLRLRPRLFGARSHGQRAARLWRRDSTCASAGAGPAMPSAVVANADRARKEFGWVPRLDNLDGIVSDALAWERKLSMKNSSR